MDLRYSEEDDEFRARARAWLKKTPPNQVLTVDIGAARSLGVYPMPVAAQKLVIGSTRS